MKDSTFCVVWFGCVPHAPGHARITTPSPIAAPSLPHQSKVLNPTQFAEILGGRGFPFEADKIKEYSSAEDAAEQIKETNIKGDLGNGECV